MELGQMVFGNPVGRFECPEYVTALVKDLLDEISRVFWNREQRVWDQYEDPKIPGIIFHPYYWGDNEECASLPNFKQVSDEAEIRWYKHPGRGMSVNVDRTPRGWVKWYNDVKQTITMTEGR